MCFPFIYVYLVHWATLLIYNLDVETGVNERRRMIIYLPTLNNEHSEAWFKENFEIYL